MEELEDERLLTDDSLSSSTARIDNPLLVPEKTCWTKSRSTAKSIIAAGITAPPLTVSVRIARTVMSVLSVNE